MGGGGAFEWNQHDGKVSEKVAVKEGLSLIVISMVFYHYVYDIAMVSTAVCFEVQHSNNF